MKLKCPGCGSILQVPETAAGKVVKCKCGKQLRAPGGPASGQTPPSAKPAAPSGQRPPANPAARPAPPSRPPAAAANSLDADLFDELTETDLAPVAAVKRPGAPVNPYKPSGNANKMLEEAAAGGDRRGEALTMKGRAPQPVFLIIVGVINGIWTFIYLGLAGLMLGAAAFFPSIAEGMEEEIPVAAGIVFALLAAGAIFLALISMATCISCFVRKSICWYVLLFSYGYSAADRIFGTIGNFMSEDGTAGGFGSLIGVGIGLALWGYMHGDDVRAFYDTEGSPIGKMLTADILGFVMGGAMGAVAVFMV